MKKSLLSIVSLLVCIGCVLSMAGCGGTAAKEKVLIYTSAEDYRIEYMQQRLNEKFPNYEVKIEYFTTGDHAAKLITEGKNTACDITYDLEYTYLEKMEKAGNLADLSEICDMSAFAEDVCYSKFYAPESRNGGAIIINTKLLAEKNLPEPASYNDLLNDCYKGLISMPNPKSSGTGYMFLLSLVNAWGETAAFEYFDKLSQNILSFTSSGSGPINALIGEEAVIGLGMTGQAVEKINSESCPFKIIYFEEGSPFSLYGQGIIEGKQNRKCVTEVLNFLVGEYGYENCEKFFPERVYADKTFDVANYPQNIVYADMKNNTPEQKDSLLSKWKY